MTKEPILRLFPAPKGFTLIELLVVIAIVAVLALITLMLTGKLRDKSRQVTAINTIKQAGTANMGFSLDNNGDINVARVQTETNVERRIGRWATDSFWGRLIPHLYPEITTSNQIDAQREMLRHLSSLTGSSDVNTMAGTFQQGTPVYKDGSGLPVPFAFNNNLAPWNVNMKTNQVDNSSQTAYMAFGWYRFTDVDFASYYPRPTSNSRANRRIDYFNDKTACVIFLDGHMEILPPPLPARRINLAP